MGLSLGVTMRVGIVLMAAALYHGMTAWVAIMAMVMPMRRGCIDRVGNPALLPYLRCLCHLVIIFVATPLRMGNEAAQRRLVHMAREGYLWIPHTQRPRVSRLPCTHRSLGVLTTPSAGGDCKRRYDSWRPSPAVWAWLLFRCLT